MLILRRRAGESLLIGDDVELQILETGAWGVKVGISAPKTISILRKELQMTRAANRDAARDVPLAKLNYAKLFPISSSHKSSPSR